MSPLKSRIISLSTILLSFFALGEAEDLPPYKPCPLFRAYYPPPTLDKSLDWVKNFTRDFTTTFDKLVRTGNHEIYGDITPNTTSFSVVLFSGAESGPGAAKDDPVFFSYHHTAPGAKAKENVSLDTVFPVGSLTQLFTVYAWLAKFGDTEWDTPITKYIPELLTGPTSVKLAVPWKDVTIGALASHMAGIVRNSNACQLGKPCDRQTISQTAPVFLPDTTPILSNAAFQLLAIAMTNAPGGPKGTIPNFNDVIQKTILQPLKMTRTTLLGSPLPPNTALFGPGLNISSPGEQASLSLLSTPYDLALLGHSILASALLSPPTTRRWLTSHATTSNLRNGVGRPWEVYHASNPVADIFLKSGTIGSYSSYMGVSPDVNAGFVVLAHDSTGKAADLNVYADVVADSVALLLGVAAREVAGEYAGEYAGVFGGKGSGNGTTETAVELKAAKDGPGLVIAKMVVKGRDVRAETARKAGIEIGNLDWRVYPAIKTKEAHQFVAVVQDVSAPVDAGTPTCITWMTVGELGAGVVERVVFGLDGTGRAVSVEIPVEGVELARA